MSAGSCVASRSRSRLDISASVTWLNSDSRRARRPTLAELEADYISEVLAASRGNKSEAARVLGISRKNLYERLAREGADAGCRVSDVGEKRVTDG